jgi:DNA invertase Pin-like site-specific DNA recombinase
MKAYSYKRWSSDRQTCGDSLTRQTRSAKAVCEKFKWELDESLEPDAGRSAFTGSNLTNGSLGKFLQAVQSKRIATPCVLVIDDMSRLTRLPFKQATREFEDILESGVKICTADDEQVYDSSSRNSLWSLLLPFMKLEAAHKYAADIGRKVREARVREREDIVKYRKICTKNAPSWLRVVGDYERFEVIIDKAAIVQRIFTSYVNGKGLRTIMRELNQEGVPSFGKGRQNKGKWSSTHMRRLLCSRSVLGEYQPHRNETRHKRVPVGAPVTDFYPAIIDTSTFYRAQELLKNHTHKSGPKKNAANLFTGFVKCGKCGGSMVIKRSGIHRGNPKWSYVSLICSNSTNGKGCKYHAIRYEWVERAILTVLWTKVLPAMSQGDDRQQKLATLKGELADTQTKHKTLLGHMEKDGVFPEGVMKIVAGYESKIKSLTEEIGALSAKLQENALGSWRQVEKTVENRLRLQSILADEIERLVIDAGNLKALLQLRNVDEDIDLQWTRENQSGFTFLGGKQSPYLDDVLVWKSDKNFVGELVIKFDSELKKAA